MLAQDRPITESKRPAKKHENRPDHDLDVEPYRPIVDVVKIVFHAFADIQGRLGFSAKAVHLRPSRQAWTNATAKRKEIELLIE